MLLQLVIIKKYYIPINIETGEATYFMKGTKCIFLINYDGEYYSV